MRTLHIALLISSIAPCGCGFPQPTFDGSSDGSTDSSVASDTGSETIASDAPPSDVVVDNSLDTTPAEAGDADAGFDQQSDGGCLAGQKVCGGQCVSVADPTFGCGPATCTPCSSSHGKASCKNETCAVGSCDPGWADCNNQPSDGCEESTSSSSANCGACGSPCAFQHAAASCSAGVCVMGACDKDFSDCNSATVDGCEGNLLNDPGHCGTCTTVCAGNPGTAVCLNGVCGVSNCPTGSQDCNHDPSDGCEIDVTSSLTNCGFCGNLCAVANSIFVCSSSVCELASCNPDFGNCDAIETNGCETNIGSSTQNCGFCGTKCPTPINSVATCASGTCGYQCQGAYADCNSLSSDGCEVNTISDVANCGACGFGCLFPRAAATCSGSVCAMGACNTGWDNCDGNAANGCEINLNTNPMHCGLCGKVCPGATNATANCAAGTCTVQCNSGWADCDSNSANGCEHVKLSYKEAVLADGPVGYWRLGEPAGPTALDFSGHGLDLTFHPGVTTGAAGALYCDADKAMKFVSSASGWLGRGTTLSLEPAIAITIELWMLQTGTPTLYEKPVWYGDSTVSPWGSWGLQRDMAAASDFAFLINLGGTAEWLVSNSFTQKDAWYHVALSYDGAWMRMYINGAVDTEKTATGTITYANNGYAFTIGACDVPASYFNGSIDEVSVYDKALTASRINAHYKAGTL